MQRPEPLRKEQLQHPKTRRSRFNGDLIRPAEKQGFMARRQAAGVSTVYGSEKPARPATGPQRDITGRVKPPDPAPAAPPLTDRQMRQLHNHK